MRILPPLKNKESKSKSNQWYVLENPKFHKKPTELKRWHAHAMQENRCGSAGMPLNIFMVLLVHF